MTTIIVSGTDTGIGKTVFAAMLTLALDGVYWKPVQAGVRDGTDTETVAAITGLDDSHIHPERVVLTEPLSPHRSAELDGVEIHADDLKPPDDIPPGRPLVIEGAGGLLVPINRSTLFIDVFRRWRAPVALCARTTLGTINHTLLSVEALRRCEIPILGIAFIGDEAPDTERTIVEFSGVKRLGRLPRLSRLAAAELERAFDAEFDQNDFVHPAGR